MYVEVCEINIDGWRDNFRSFDNVVTTSRYRSEENGYEEGVVVEYKDEDGNIVSETIRSEYGARIVHVEE